MPLSVGEPLNRVDGPMKVTGRATYTADFRIPNLVHAVLATSSIAKGRIVSIDTADAEGVPGVLAVLTHKSNLKLAKDPTAVDRSQPADRALQVLQDDRIFYSNQPIGVAVATTFEAAREAAAKIHARYSVETPSVRIEQNLASAYIPKTAGSGSDPSQTHRGNIEQGLSAGDVRIEEIYSHSISIPIRRWNRTRPPPCGTARTGSPCTKQPRESSGIGSACLSSWD